MQISKEEITQLCRVHIEACEKWARLFIHNVLSTKLCADYLQAVKPNGDRYIRKSAIEQAQKRMNEEPGRFPSLLDAMVIEDTIYILCHPELYKNFFAQYLSSYYPEGVNELRTFLNRIANVRNKLCHVNPISARDAEQAICYSNDFIDAVKNYFTMNKQDKEFNVPTILSISDSLGNQYLSKDSSDEIISITLIDPSTKQTKALEFGDSVTINLEIDPSFPEDSYDLKWNKCENLEIYENGRKINFTIGNELVGERKSLCCRVISKKPWHRYGKYDQTLLVYFKALPPRE